MLYNRECTQHPAAKAMFDRVAAKAAKYVEAAVRESQPGGGVFLAFAESGELAGTGAIHISDEDKEQKRAKLLLISVDEKFRRQGVATAVIGKLCQIAREECDAERVYLLTAQSMDSALALYRKLGFEETLMDTSVVPNMPKEAGPVVKFEKNLLAQE